MKCCIAIRSCLILLTFLFFSQPVMAVLAPASIPTFEMRFRVVSVDHRSAAGMNFTLGTEKSFLASSANGDWSNWAAFGMPQLMRGLQQYPNLYLKRFPFIVKLHLNKVQGITLLQMEVRLTETGQLVAMHAELNGPTLGLALWRDISGKPLVGTFADYNRQVIWNKLPDISSDRPVFPHKLLIVDRFIGGSDDVIEWREGISNLARYGSNTMLLGAPATARSILNEAGVSHVAGAIYSPPGYAFDFPYLNHDMRKGPAAAGQSADQLLNAWAASLTKPYAVAGYGMKDIALYHLADEPGWYYPRAIDDLAANPAGMARFHDYLRTHSLRPADFGAASWDEVKPIDISQAIDPAKRKLFYWTMEFFPWDSATHFAASTRAMDKSFYPGIPDPVNWNFFSGRSYVPGPVANNPAKSSPDAAMGGHDWFEFAQLHGSNMLWTEDWFSDTQASSWSFYASKLESAARKANISWGGYVVPRSSGETEQGLMQKVLSVFGNGGKAIEYFTFGPEYNFPGNCYSPHADVILPRMAQVAGMVAKAEDLLWPGQRPQAQVAILQPRSSEVWDHNGISDATNTDLNSHTVDYMAEVYDLYRGLQQENIPADFVPEDALTSQGLSGYKVLYITEPDFPQEWIPLLLQWVRNGGTLVSVSGAFTADRYDVPMTAFQQARDIVEVPRQRLSIVNAGFLTPVDSIDGSWNVYGARGVIREFHGTVLARFSDGTPAILERKLERGMFMHFAFLPGISAYVSGNSKHDLPSVSGLGNFLPRSSAYLSHGQAPGSYLEVALKWIAYPVYQSGVHPPVTVDQLDVETPLLLSKNGGVVTLLNWSGKSVSQLKVKAHLPFQVSTVESVTTGKIQFSQSENTVEFSMPLGAADIVMFKK